MMNVSLNYLCDLILYKIKYAIGSHFTVFEWKSILQRNKQFWPDMQSESTGNFELPAWNMSLPRLFKFC